jgi:hypothetical protein
MHSAVVVIEIPKPTYDTSVPSAWRNFLAEVDMPVSRPALDQQPGVSRLGENVWLVNLQENPLALGRLLRSVENFQFSYGILPLDAGPQWLPVGFDPKPK